MKIAETIVNLLLDELEEHDLINDEYDIIETKLKDKLIEIVNDVMRVKALDIISTLSNDNKAIITKVSKEDLKEAFKDNKKALKIIEEMDSDDLQRLAERMANDYIEQLYWDSLKAIFTEMFLEGKEEG